MTKTTFSTLSQSLVLSPRLLSVLSQESERLEMLNSDLKAQIEELKLERQQLILMLNRHRPTCIVRTDSVKTPESEANPLLQQLEAKWRCGAFEQFTVEEKQPTSSTYLWASDVDPITSDSVLAVKSYLFLFVSLCFPVYLSSWSSELPPLSVWSYLFSALTIVQHIFPAAEMEFFPLSKTSVVNINSVISAVHLVSYKLPIFICWFTVCLV